MSQYFEIHPDNPQLRLIRNAVAIIGDGGVAVVPTDSTYAIVCHLDDKSAVERIQRIRQLEKDHNFTLLCRDLSEIASYARVDNTAYRLLKAHTPGPYTFLLRATAEVPRRLQHPKRKTIGIRVPDHAILQALLAEHGQPLMSVSLILPGMPVERYVHPDEFEEMRTEALALGFKHVESGPLVRSSYHARDQVPEASKRNRTARSAAFAANGLATGS